MKSLINSSVFILVLFFGVSLYAQQLPGNAVIIQKLEANFNNGGTMAEFDSLAHLYNTRVLDKNPLIVSHKTLRHWWGHDNSEIIQIVEVKSWADVDEFNMKNNELFEEAWATEEERKAFDDAFGKYFTGRHSDEIYREVGGPR
jgi:hypothetical protein